LGGVSATGWVVAARCAYDFVIAALAATAQVRAIHGVAASRNRPRYLVFRGCWVDDLFVDFI